MTAQENGGFEANIARAEQLLADRERRLDARPKPAFSTRTAVAFMIGIVTIGAGLFAAGATFAVFIGPGE